MQGEANFTSDNVVTAPEDEMSMAELLDQQSFEMQPVKKGTIIKGTIVSISPNEILVDVGYKYEGIVKSKDLERVDPEYLETLNVGDEIPIYVIHLADEDGYVILSLNKAAIERDWDKAQKFYEAGESFESEVVSTNKGGLIANFGAVRGFIPGSQLDNARMGGDRGKQWSNFIGKKLHLKIIEVDRRRNRLILSEKAAVQELRKKQKAERLAELTEGEVLQGRITSLADFGAFVDLNGTEGLVHLSELSWAQVSHPRNVLKVGEKVDVYILNIDYDRQRVGLSLKRLQPEPWSTVLDHYQPGQIVTATVTKLTNFGAFARIDNTIEGLIHISELADRQIGHPREVVKENEEVQVRIISIEPEKRRMGLSIKQADQVEDFDDEEAPEEVSIDDEAAPEAEAPVENEVSTEVEPEESPAEVEAEAPVENEASAEVEPEEVPAEAEPAAKGA